MSTTVTYKGNTITTVNNETRTLLTQDKWVEDDIVITDESRGGVDTETDPVFSASPAAFITQSDIINWNTKSNFSGNYNDLTNKPTIPAAQVSSDWNATSGIAQILHKPTLSDVATSGDYEDLINKPNIPTAVSDLNNDRGFITTEIDPVFSVSPAAGITSNDITSWNNKSDFSGSYNDLTDKPTIAGQVNSDWNANSGVAKILNKPTLAYVAMSGNYNDLTNKPVLDTSLSTASTRAVENQAISIALEGKASKQYVDTAISNIPSPMVFKGSLGTSGTITTLPNADATNTGFTYKVIQAGTYASQAAEIGDIFISDGTTWILVPSGDDIANVVVTPVQSSGTKIAVVTVNNTSTDLYAPTPVAPPNASTLAPNMDGTAAAGTSTSYARADHIHPVDTSRASANDVSNLTTRVGNLETAIGTGGSVDNKIATAIQELDSSIAATSGEAISAITITDGKITTSSKITIPTYTIATTAANGLMSSSDKIKLNNLSTVDNNTTYTNATTATDGLMSSADKLKLDNCSTGSATALQYVKDGPYQSVLLGDVTNNTASGVYSVAEGNSTSATAQCAHAEGQGTKAAGDNSHAEGFFTQALKSNAHAEGRQTTASGYHSHAEGSATLASGSYAHAQGAYTQAAGGSAHAEGSAALASGYHSHAEGNATTAQGESSHAEGYMTLASTSSAHAEGSEAQATGYAAHAEGSVTTASGYASHTEGEGTIANFKSQHVFGEYNIVDPSTRTSPSTFGDYVEIVGNGTTAARSNARTLDWFGNEVLAGKLTVGADPTAPMEVATKQYVDNNSGGGGASYQYIADGSFNSVLLGNINTNTASGQYSIAEGYNTKAEGQASHAEGYDTKTVGNWSHSEGRGTRANGNYSHTEGMQTTASGLYSHAEGQVTLASESGSHAEGYATTASESYSHAEGDNTLASGLKSHAEGNYTVASGTNSHAEGNHTNASYDDTHAEGYYTQSDGHASHAEGNATTALGNYSHTEGYETKASTVAAHAEGYGTIASGGYSHTEGWGAQANARASHAGGLYTFASQDYQTVIGKFNYINSSTASVDAAFVIGNGASTASRSDAFAVKWDGTLVFANGTEITPAQFAQLLTLLN